MLKRGEHFVDWFMTGREEIYQMQPLSKMIGEEFIEIDKSTGRVKIKYVIDRLLCNYSGKVHGGIIALLLDEAIGASSFCVVGQLFRCTIEAKVNYFRPLRPGDIFVEAWMSHQAKTMLFMEAQLYDEAGSVFAKSSATISVESEQ